MRILDSQRDAEAVGALLARDPFTGTAEQAEQAAAIVQDVREHGDHAVVEWTRKLDCPTMAVERLRVTRDQLAAAREAVSREFINAVGLAIGNLTDFHRRQVRQDWFTPRPGGGWVGQRFTPIDRVGVYVPGGRAVLPSTLLHVCVPAQVAGVGQLAVCTPPRPDGTGEVHLLAAAAMLGLDEIYLVGGAQAIAALAYGTATIPKVDLIAGPGNPWVNHAKRLVYGLVGIDSLAGPSEILIIADDAAHPTQVAADLLSQAEHSVDARAILLTPSPGLAERVSGEVDRQLAELRNPAAQQALQEVGGIVVTADLAEACRLADLCAPEHLQIIVDEPSRLLGRVRNAGAVFLGDCSPEPLGDYVAGPSHVLPTGGTARFASPLSVDTFVKKTSLIAYERESLGAEAEAIITLARAEGLEAHARSVETRLD